MEPYISNSKSKFVKIGVALWLVLLAISTKGFAQGYDDSFYKEKKLQPGKSVPNGMGFSHLTQYGVVYLGQTPQSQAENERRDQQTYGAQSDAYYREQGLPVNGYYAPMNAGSCAAELGNRRNSDGTTNGPDILPY